jgi:hypothetical protein
LDAAQCVIGFLDDEGDICVAVQAEHFGRVEVGEDSLNGQLEVLNSVTVQTVIVLVVRVVVFLPRSRSNQIGIKAFLESAHQADPI